METRTREDNVASRQRVQRGYLWGFSAGVLPNLVIFMALFLLPVNEQKYDWLAVGVLYAGPLVVGLAGLVLIFSGRTRRCGVGLILAAAITVALWFVADYIFTANMLASNNAGG